MTSWISRTLTGTFASVLLMGLSSAALAAEKDYTVTSADGVKIAVQETGDPAGAPIVFVHGLLGSHIDWNEQTTSRELQSYRLITYDMRGHGLSGKPDDADAYHDGRRWADDLASVLRATGAQKPILVGWSLGGVVLSNYLAAYGDDGISGLVYVDGVIELNASLITSHPKVYADLASDDLTVHLDAVRTFLALCFQAQPDKATFERLLSNAALASWVMTKTIPSMTVAAAEGLPKAHVPVLMVYGGKDALVNPEPSIARAKALNSTIKTAVYANSGHAPFLEEAPRFNRDLAEFTEASTKE